MNYQKNLKNNEILPVLIAAFIIVIIASLYILNKQTNIAPPLTEKQQLERMLEQVKRQISEVKTLDAIENKRGL